MEKLALYRLTFENESSRSLDNEVNRYSVLLTQQMASVQGFQNYDYVDTSADWPRHYHVCVVTYYAEDPIVADWWA